MNGNKIKHLCCFGHSLAKHLNLKRELLGESPRLVTLAHLELAVGGMKGY